MICPSCKSDMIGVEYHRIELDYCPRCHGVWFDAGELELLLEAGGLESPRFLNNIMRSAEAQSAETKLRCPICTQKMKKTIAGEQPKVTIDVCGRGDGLWFDGGELDQVIRQLPGKEGQGGGPSSDVIAFLGETFKAQE